MSASSLRSSTAVRQDCVRMSMVGLDAWLQQRREDILTGEKEMMRRQYGTDIDQSPEVDDCCVLLLKTNDRLCIVSRVEGKKLKQVETAIAVLTNVQSHRSFSMYQSFLLDVLRYCGEVIVLLCALGLGKKRILDLGLHGRASLVSWLRATQLLNRTILDPMAQDLEMPFWNSKSSFLVSSSCVMYC